MSLKSKSKKRYYWHRKLKQTGLHYDARKNTIFIPSDFEGEIPKPASYLVKEYGYALQTFIA